jgi:hypothetical protein
LHAQEHHYYIPVFIPYLKINLFVTRLLGKDNAKCSSILPCFIFYTLAAARPIDGSVLQFPWRPPSNVSVYAFSTPRIQ